MPKNKQHFIPRVYLKAFLDHSVPEDWPPNRPFESAVWVSHPTDLNGFRRKATKNILWKLRLYNLDDDDPDQPWLEDSLSRLEGAYDRVLRDVVDRRELVPETYGIFLLFVGALRGRTPESIENRQGFVDQLERIHREVVMGHPAAEEDARKLFAKSHEAGKRLLPLWTQTYAEVICTRGFFLVNRSPLEFITSDSPVAHVFRHVDEDPVACFPHPRKAKVTRSTKGFFSFVALNPHLAFVSSPLLDPGDGLYTETDDPALVFALNQLTRENANELIIASSSRPYGELTEAVSEAEASTTTVLASGIHIYTSDDRFWIPSGDVDHALGSHPLISRVTFTTESLGVLRRIGIGTKIRELDIYETGHQVGHLKGAHLIHIAASPSERSVIETSLEDLGSS